MTANRIGELSAEFGAGIEWWRSIRIADCASAYRQARGIEFAIEEGIVRVLELVELGELQIPVIQSISTALSKAA